jgi:ppGpp synthetase/RelA/SpoT-type nucleotidyltranferase
MTRRRVGRESGDHRTQGGDSRRPGVPDMALTKGEIDRLGDRLKAAGVPDAADLAVLQELRREFDAALSDAQAMIIESIPTVRPTSRLKTVQTLVGKLRREATMNLGQMQDVAGLRVVRPMSVLEQDELAARIAGLFGGAKVMDRRAKPSHGYRAVHVIARVDGRLVEIQLRTALQDRWAQILERLADRWGRDIRYGAEPESPHERVGAYTRRSIVGLVRRLSPLIAECEETDRQRPAAGRLALSSTAYCRAVSDALDRLGRLRVDDPEAGL